MKAAHFNLLWFFIFCLLSFEFYQLNFRPEHSLLAIAQKRAYISSGINLSPEPGRPISWKLGWAGIGVMMLTNLYIFRKRFSLLQKIGKLSNWLDFHIFCGLLGPTFILFHCNFKVRGLVAISFWSMVVSVVSGVIGRYLYLQMARAGSDYTSDAEKIWTRVEKSIEHRKIQVTSVQKDQMKNLALAYVGADRDPTNPFSALWIAFSRDIATFVGKRLVVPLPISEGATIALRQYALNMRRARFIGSFQKMMSYWHTFHMPFAVFMYLAAAAHIAAALILGVKK